VAVHLSSCHKKWPAIFCNYYLYGPVQKITILVSAHLRSRYQKARWSLVSIVLSQSLLIIYYLYQLVSSPILVSATVISRYQYWIQGVNSRSSSGKNTYTYIIYYKYINKTNLPPFSCLKNSLHMQPIRSQVIVLINLFNTIFKTLKWLI
jgi:hypothetical protein